MIASFFFNTDPEEMLNRRDAFIRLKGLIVAVQRVSGARHRIVAENYVGHPHIPDTPESLLDVIPTMLERFATHIERVDGYDESLVVEQP